MPRKASDPLVGRRIVEVRHMSKKEQSEHDWYAAAIVLVLDDGTILYPSQDDEGNGPGSLWGIDPDGESFGYPTQR